MYLVGMEGVGLLSQDASIPDPMEMLKKQQEKIDTMRKAMAQDPVAKDAERMKKMLIWGTVGIGVLGLATIGGIVWLLARKKARPSAVSGTRRRRRR